MSDELHNRRSDDVDKLKVRVTDMEKSFSEIRGLIAMREERSKDIHEKVDKIYTALIGDIEEPQNPGFITRVDRLEQAEKYRNYLYVGVFGLIMNAVYEWLKNPRG